MSKFACPMVGHLLALAAALAIFIGPQPLQAGELPPLGPPPDDPRPTRVYRSLLEGRLWTRAEYLLWAADGQNLPPLVTTSPAGTPLDEAGVLGQPGTTVLFGDESVNEGMISGGRFTLGFWRDLPHTTGVQATYFGLVERFEGAHLPGLVDAIVARPYWNVATDQPDSELVAYPDVLDGQIDVQARTRFQGAEVLWRSCVLGTDRLRVDLLAGYRYSQLFDRLSLDQDSVSLDESSGYAVDTEIVRSDAFQSRNAFHGGELGLVADWGRNRWNVELTGKIAFGRTWTDVGINGQSTVYGATTETYTGGLLALPTNIGFYTDSQFAVTPEFGLSLEYRLTYYTRLAVGYDLLGWSRVSRAQDQIDLAINPSQIPPETTLVGEARPRFAMNWSDFWAQGLNFRIECQF